MVHSYTFLSHSADFKKWYSHSLSHSADFQKWHSHSHNVPLEWEWNYGMMGMGMMICNSGLNNSETKLSGLKKNWEILGFMAFFYYSRSKKWKFQKINLFFSWKMFLRNRKRINLTFFLYSNVSFYCIRLFWTLKIGKTRRLNFVSFWGLENGETKLRK